MIGVVRMHRPKESWAAKRAEQALRCECSEDRLLLGQREVKTFPVLDMEHAAGSGTRGLAAKFSWAGGETRHA